MNIKFESFRNIITLGFAEFKQHTFYMTWNIYFELFKFQSWFCKINSIEHFIRNES